MQMKKKCFADRKDGTCHALSKKKCKDCKFYFPRKNLYHNPFYEYSYENEYAFENAKRIYKVPDDLIMKADE